MPPLETTHLLPPNSLRTFRKRLFTRLLEIVHAGKSQPEAIIEGARGGRSGHRRWSLASNNNRVPRGIPSRSPRTPSLRARREIGGSPAPCCSPPLARTA